MNNGLMQLVSMMQQQGQQQPGDQPQMPIMGSAPSAEEEMGLATLGQGKVLEQEPMQPLNGPSEKNVGDVEGNFNRAYNLSMGNQGIGSLAGGIAALVLGPKMRKVREQAEGNRLKAQNLQMEAEELKNLRTKQAITQQESLINRQKSADAYFRFNTGISENPMEDARIAGIEFWESGVPKTNFQKLQEMPMSKGMDIQGLVKFAPGLMDMLAQPYSHITSEALRAELDKAGQQKRMFDGNNLKIRAGINSRNYDDEVAALRAYSMATSQMVRMMQDAADMQYTDPAMAQELMKYVTSNLSLYSNFGQKRGLKSVPNPEQAAKGLFDYGKGDPQGLQMVIQGLIQSGQEAGKQAQIPQNAAKKVKDKKPPVAVGVEKPPVQTSAQPNITESALELLGGEQ